MSQLPAESPDHTSPPAPAPDAPPAPLNAGPGEPAPPGDWSMLLIMLAIIAALGFGGTAMMYRRAEASKLQAEAAARDLMLAREDAELARKQARAQQRQAEDLRARLAAQLTRADERPAAEPATPLMTPASAPAAGPRPAPTPALTPVSGAASPSPLLDPVEPGMPVAESDMRAVLDAAARELDAASGRSPAADAAVHSTLGRTYLDLGDRDRAARHLRRAIELRTPIAGAKDPEVIKDKEALDRAVRPLR